MTNVEFFAIIKMPKKSIFISFSQIFEFFQKNTKVCPFCRRNPYLIAEKRKKDKKAAIKWKTGRKL